MPLATATIAYTLKDKVGVALDSRRTHIWATTSTETVIDTDGNVIRLGSGRGTIGNDGSGQIEVWIPGTGSNPASWQTTIHVDYIDGRQRKQEHFGPFTITASGDLADLIEEQAVEPTYAGVLVAQLEAIRDDVVQISGIDSTDSAVAALVETAAGPLTQAALSATIETEGAVLFGPVVTPEAYGAVGDGITDDTAAIQSMFDALRTAGVPRFVRFTEGANYALTAEVAVNADYVSVQAHGATFTGPAAGTPEGGLVTIVDRADLTHTVTWVSWFGGRFVTNHAADNGFNVVAAEHFLVSGLGIDATTGQYGMAIQSNSLIAANLRRGTITDIEVKGADVGIECGTSDVDAKMTDVAIRGIRTTDCTTGVKVSANNSAYRVHRVHVSDIEAIGSTYGVHFYYVLEGSIRNITVGAGAGYGLAAAYNERSSFSGLRILDRTTGYGIDAQNCTDCKFTDGYITGSASTVRGVSITGSGGGNEFDGFILDGTFSQAFYDTAVQTTGRNITIKDAAVGIYNAGGATRALWDGVIFENVATRVNAYTSTSKYRNMFWRDGSTTHDVSKTALTSVDVPIIGYVSQVTWATLTTDKTIRSTGAVNSSITYRASCGVGTYTLRLAHIFGTDRGIYDVTIDGVSVGTIDGYAAAPAHGINSLTGLSITTTGEHTIVLTMATKNASSSSYVGDVLALALMQQS